MANIADDDDDATAAVFVKHRHWLGDESNNSRRYVIATPTADAVFLVAGLSYCCFDHPVRSRHCVIIVADRHREARSFE
jgi:hypothetical protein